MNEYFRNDEFVWPTAPCKRLTLSKIYALCVFACCDDYLKLIKKSFFFSKKLSMRLLSRKKVVGHSNSIKKGISIFELKLNMKEIKVKFFYFLLFTKIQLEITLFNFVACMRFVFSFTFIHHKNRIILSKKDD